MKTLTYSQDLQKSFPKKWIPVMHDPFDTSEVCAWQGGCYA